jgi:hypothetical protein
MTWLLLGLTVLVSAALWLLSSRLVFAHAAAVGWLLSGALAMFGWWMAHKAMRAEPGAWMRYVFGGMAIRLVAIGILCGVVLGAGLLEPAGFVGGLFVGVIVFQTVEVMGLACSPRRGTSHVG